MGIIHRDARRADGAVRAHRDPNPPTILAVVPLYRCDPARALRASFGIAAGNPHQRSMSESLPHSDRTDRGAIDDPLRAQHTGPLLMDARSQERSTAP